MIELYCVSFRQVEGTHPLENGASFLAVLIESPIPQTLRSLDPYGLEVTKSHSLRVMEADCPHHSMPTDADSHPEQNISRNFWVSIHL